MKHTFRVTAEDIERGVPFECSLCPVARAIKREFGDIEVEVGIENILIDTKYFPTPEPVKTFIDLFDNQTSRHLAKPFGFELEIPD